MHFESEPNICMRAEGIDKNDTTDREAVTLDSKKDIVFVCARLLLLIFKDGNLDVISTEIPCPIWKRILISFIKCAEYFI